MTLTVARVESFKFLRHPITWILLIIAMSFMAFLFYRLCLDYLQLAEEALFQRDIHSKLSVNVIKPLCSWTILILSIVFPVFTTLAISQELKQKTFYLWATSSIRAGALVIGKFISLTFLLSIILGFLAILIGTLSIETNLDWNMVVTSLIAVGLLGTSFISFGLFISSIIPYPLLAIGITLLGNALWMLLEWVDPFPMAGWQSFAKETSLLNHCYHLLNGIIYSPDLTYYMLFDFFWLLITWRVVYNKLIKVKS